MIEAWRLEKEKYAADAFKGEGSVRVSGRWHHKGTRVVYVSETVALAIIEKFVHVGHYSSKIKLVSFKILIPKSIIKIVDIKHLPSDWKDQPPGDSTKDLGTAWALSAKTAVLKVPSVLAPESWNLLLNPDHPDFKRVIINMPSPYRFDDRMFKKK